MISLDGHPVLCGRLLLPRVGRWIFDGELATDEVPAGSVELSDGDQTFKGHVFRAGNVGGRVHARVIGGSGGLANVQEPQNLRGVTALAALSTVLSACGESLDPSTSPASTSATFSFISLPHTTGGAQLSIICKQAGLVWRMRPGGAVWAGAESEGLTSPEEAFVLDGNASAGRYHAAIDGLWLIPGMVQGAGTVQRVEYEFGEHVRVTYWAA